MKTSDFLLVKLEQTLLQMASMPDVSKGVIFFVVIPLEEDFWMLRYNLYKSVLLILSPICIFPSIFFLFYFSDILKVVFIWASQRKS